MDEKRVVTFRTYLEEHPEANCADIFSRSWPAATLVCSWCGQPDRGECNCLEIGKDNIRKLLETTEQEALARLV